MKKKLLLIGGGGHCGAVADTLLSLNAFDEIGIIDNDSDKCKCGIRVVGNDDDLPKLFAEGWNFAFICVGSIGDTYLRRKLYSNAKELGFAFPVIIDKTAAVSFSAKIAEGTYIGKLVVVNNDANIGTCCIINSGSVIEHNCKIGDFVHIAPGAVLCGEVKIGNDTHIGTGSCVRQQISVGSNSLIGIGSVVVKDVPENSVAYGNPCKVKEE